MSIGELNSSRSDTRKPITDSISVGSKSRLNLLKPKLSHESEVALSLLRSLWTNNLPDWVTPLTNNELPVPKSLSDAVRRERVKSIFTDEPPISDGTLTWASNSNSFKNHMGRLCSPFIADFFKNLFRTIEENTTHHISPQDLFHGHMFYIPRGTLPDIPRTGELGILFHCKEYPSDLEKLKGLNSGFTSESRDYKDRNILYLMSQNRMFILKPPLPSPDIQDVTLTSSLLEGMDEWNEMGKPENGGKEAQENLLAFCNDKIPFTSAYAVRADVFYKLGQKLPDVNYLPSNLNKIETEHPVVISNTQSSDFILFFK